MPKSSTKSIALSPERLAVLLALAQAPADAPGIHDQVLADTIGAIYIAHSTLYYLLDSLEKSGYINHTTAYDLTPKGWEELKHDLARTEQRARLLKIRLSPRQYLAAQSHN